MNSMDCDFFLIAPVEREANRTPFAPSIVRRTQFEPQNERTTSTDDLVNNFGLESFQTPRRRVEHCSTSVPAVSKLESGAEPTPLLSPHSPTMTEENSFVHSDQAGTTVISPDEDNVILRTPERQQCNPHEIISTEKSLNFGPESFITPQASQRPNLMDMPAPRKLRFSDREESKRIRLEQGPQTPMNKCEMEYKEELTIPQLTSKRDFRLIPSQNKSIFLQPRMNRHSTSPPRIVRKCSLKDRELSSDVEILNDSPFFKNLRIKTNIRKHKLERRVLFPA